MKYCRLYGAAPTKTVKDATPSGYTDDGTAWIKKDAAPAGYTDDGTQWVKVVPKEARIVPACNSRPAPAHEGRRRLTPCPRLRAYALRPGRSPALSPAPSPGGR